MKLATCIGCGCDDGNACVGIFGEGCAWLEVDRKKGVGVCSECLGELKRWKKHDRSLSLRALLRWAIGYVEELNASLRESHMPPRTKRMKPASARRRYAEAKRWLKSAREAFEKDWWAAR